LQISKNLLTGKTTSYKGTTRMTDYRITHIFSGLEDRNLLPDILDMAKTMKFL